MTGSQGISEHRGAQPIWAVALLLLFVQMLGTITPLFLFPQEAFITVLKT